MCSRRLHLRRRGAPPCGGLLCCLRPPPAQLAEVELGELSEAPAEETGGGGDDAWRVCFYEVEKKRQMKLKCELVFCWDGDETRLKVGHTWCEAVMKAKATRAVETRLRSYAASLAAVHDAHADRLRSHGAGAFPLAPSDIVKLVHFLPLIPTAAKFMNLGSFLAKPAAADFLFLQPLVRCAQPAPAKAAFFAALPKLKIAVKAIADGAELSPAAAAAVVDTVVEALDQAAAAGGGVA